MVLFSTALWWLALQRWGNIPPWTLPTVVWIISIFTLTAVYVYARREYWKLEAHRQEIEEKNAALSNVHIRLDEMKRLHQFSEALNFTINYDVLLDLIYTNCQEIVNAKTFQIFLTDYRTNLLYTAFHSEDGERDREMEGPRFSVIDERIANVIEMGQIWEYTDEKERNWLVAPLTAGATSVGAIHISHKEKNQAFSPSVYDIFAKLAYQSAYALINWQTNRSLELRAKQFESLVDVISTINAELEIQSLLDLILDKAIELLDVEAGSFLMVDSTTGELEFVSVNGVKREELLHTRLPFGKGIAGQVAQNNMPKISNTVEEDAQWYAGVDEMTDFKTHSMLTVPLEYNRQVMGVLQVVNRTNGSHFTPSDQLLLTAFSNAAAISLENARLLQQTDLELQDRVQELSLLQEINKDLITNLDMQTTADRALQWMMRLFQASAGSLTLFTEDGELLGASQSNYDVDMTQYGANMRTMPGIMGHTLRHGEPLLVPNVLQEPEYLIGSEKTLSLMCLPIVHDQTVIGAVSVEREIKDGFTTDDLESASTYVNHITAAIANSRLYHQVTLANYAKSEFVSLVSHELKNPLTSIKGYGDLLLTGMAASRLDEQQEVFVRTIVANVKRMERLVKDLTDVSRIDTGQFQIRPEPIPMAAVVSETATIVQSLATEKNIDIQLKLLEKSPVVMGDQARLVQVLTNLMSNACKYSPPETSVYVSLSNGNGEVKCTVRDEGYGISMEEQDRLFTKFFRSKDPNIRQSNGTGLGLSISKAIVEMHGGEIGFESALGEGTTFWFTVPVAT
ncbi:MAG: GAF domain-containing sensor histidine kinase [Chloroflexota bacterium]